MIVTDVQPINFTCNVTTPVNSVDVTWLDGNGKHGDILVHKSLHEEFQLDYPLYLACTTCTWSSCMANVQDVNIT